MHRIALLAALAAALAGRVLVAHYAALELGFLKRWGVRPAATVDTLMLALALDGRTTQTARRDEYTLSALAARLGSAKAELLPSFYLGFLNTDGRLSIGDNLGARDQFTALGVGTRLPIFEGGRIRARIASADARLEAAAVQHEQAVLTALEDVENAYAMRHALDQRATQLTASLQHGNDAARHAQRLFEQGSTLLQPALEARLTALQREDELIQTQAARARATIAFYQAIGGGWQDNTPSRAEAAERTPR